jgi:hypothetical protein
MVPVHLLTADLRSPSNPRSLRQPKHPADRHTTGTTPAVPGDVVFIAGKPLTDIWAPPGLRWLAVIKERVPAPLRHPHLRFVRNDPCRFDLDNLVYPVLAASGSSGCESVWATVEAGPVEGVWVTDRPGPPPGPPAGVPIRIGAPNTVSIPNRLVPPELAGVDVVGPGGFVGLQLAFEPGDVHVGEMSYEGPTKSLIDDLGPLLGFRPWRDRMVSADDRVKELRVVRGQKPGAKGVVITVWPLGATTASQL